LEWKVRGRKTSESTDEKSKMKISNMEEA
jgi:hypothetical protein